MKAFVLEKYGHPLSAVDMPVPDPGPRQVLVRMVASGVNHADERTRTGVSACSAGRTSAK